MNQDIPDKVDDTRRDTHEDKPPHLEDEDAKDAGTYQRWRWDLMVY